MLVDVESLQDTDLDCVMCDLIEPTGVLRQQVLNDLAYLKYVIMIRECRSK